MDTLNALREARVAARIIDPLLNVMEEEEGGPDDYQDVVSWISSGLG